MMKIKPPESINDQVFGYLLEQIQTGRIESGTRLIETQVAKSLEASRTPVREAFRRLEQDGIVERLPQGGVRVTPVTNKLVEEIFGVRRVLEPYAIRLACERISSKEIRELKLVARLAKDTISSVEIQTEEKIKQLFKLNTQFHDIIYNASRSPYLAKLINQLRNVVLRLRVMGLKKGSAWHTAWQEHEQLIAFFEKRDTQSVSKLMKKHIENAKSAVATFANVDPGKEGHHK